MAKGPGPKMDAGSLKQEEVTDKEPKQRKRSGSLMACSGPVQGNSSPSKYLISLQDSLQRA